MGTFKDLWSAFGCGTILGLHKAMNSPEANKRAEQRMLREAGLNAPFKLDEEEVNTEKMDLASQINAYCKPLPDLYKAINWQNCITPLVPPDGEFCRRKGALSDIFPSGFVADPYTPDATVQLVGCITMIRQGYATSEANVQHNLKQLMRKFGAIRNQYYVAPYGFYEGERYFNGREWTNNDTCKVGWGCPVIRRSPEEIEYFDKVVEYIMVLSEHILGLCREFAYRVCFNKRTPEEMHEIGHMTDVEYRAQFGEKVAGRQTLF